jgi:hypothetical protein
MKTSSWNLLIVLTAIALPLAGFAQVNSGSDGHDGALIINRNSGLVIDMADHPDGIYHYTSVNIAENASVSFIPNAGNKPVVWLVQGSCAVGAVSNIYLYGQTVYQQGGQGGPGGFSGGNGGGAGMSGRDGQGPGGGRGLGSYLIAGNASFANSGGRGETQESAGDLYGSKYLLPLIGGSGGGGGTGHGGGGGGGAIMIVASGEIAVNGTIYARGGDSDYWNGKSGAGSGGAIRLVSNTLTGAGGLLVGGGACSYARNSGGAGRIRLDVLDNRFVGTVEGDVTRGFQPIILPPVNQAVSLAIQNVGGVAVAANPAGQPTTPDVIVPANQQNPIPIVVRCTNIPLNTEIIVDVKPANGATVRAVALNTAGTQASSTATVQVNMPRGGGTIQAKAVSGIALAASGGGNEKVRSLAETGWTADGERFAQVEVTAPLGGTAQIAYVTESGKHYAAPTR